MKRPPTDYELLKQIYAMHCAEFLSFAKDATGGRASKIFVPIDIPTIADHFDTDQDSIFGRLDYHPRAEVR